MHSLLKKIRKLKSSVLPKKSCNDITRMLQFALCVGNMNDGREGN